METRLTAFRVYHLNNGRKCLSLWLQVWIFFLSTIINCSTNCPNVDGNAFILLTCSRQAYYIFFRSPMRDYFSVKIPEFFLAIKYFSVNETMSGQPNKCLIHWHFENLMDSFFLLRSLFSSAQLHVVPLQALKHRPIIGLHLVEQTALDRNPSLQICGWNVNGNRSWIRD